MTEDKLAQRAPELATQAQGIVINDQATYDRAAELRKAIKFTREAWRAENDRTIRAAVEAHKAALEHWRKLDDKLAAAQRHVDAQIVTWDAQQSALREAEQKRLEAEARAKADEDAAIQAALATARGAPAAEVEEILAEPATMPMPVAAPTYERAPTVGVRHLWDAEITDLWELAKAVAANKALVNLIEGNMPAIRQMARAQEQNMAVPGIRVFKKPSVASSKF